MNVIKTPIEGLLILEPKIHGDGRGYFFESFNSNTFKDVTGLDMIFKQDNQARSKKNVLRGLHYQNPPNPQAKLLRVLQGVIWDVAVDIRKGSPTFGQWFGVELSEENKRQFLIPHGFAHGYSVLSETAEVFYKCDNLYDKSAEGGILFSDPAIGIDWKVNPTDAIISEKDTVQPLMANCINGF